MNWELYRSKKRAAARYLEDAAQDMVRCGRAESYGDYRGAEEYLERARYSQDQAARLEHELLLMKGQEERKCRMKSIAL
jgi:hypothetical protein